MPTDDFFLHDGQTANRFDKILNANLCEQYPQFRFTLRSSSDGCGELFDWVGRRVGISSSILRFLIGRSIIFLQLVRGQTILFAVSQQINKQLHEHLT